MLQSILKVFFGNIFRILGFFFVVAGILTIGFNTPVGIGMIVFGVLLLSAGTVFKG